MIERAPSRAPANRVAPLAVTMGEPAGIGGEITLKAWRHGGQPFFCIDDPSRLARLSATLGLAVPIGEIGRPEEAAAVFPVALPVLAERLAIAVEPGQPATANGEAVRRSIERAVAFTQAGQAAAVVTNPIHKHSLYQAGFGFPGHTEFLAHLAGPGVTSVMMLACPTLRVIPVTVHQPLTAAIRTLSSAGIVHCCRVADTALRRDFGLSRPRIAVSGLNPHAGEGGDMGDEEITIIEPALSVLRRDGIDVSGPYPADAMFSERQRSGYDVAVCMYHDQALIPIKTLDFDGAVNVTLGLPFVRTSPDHGTAFDIAGRGIAREHSLLAALRMAADMARARSSAEAAASS